VAALPVLALLDVFGQEPSTTTARSAAADLTVTAPTRLRSGLVFQVHVEVSAHRKLAHPEIAFARGWWDSMSVNSIVPEPSEESPDDGRVVLDYGELKAGERLSFWIYFQVNPTNVGKRREDVELRDGSHSARLRERLTTGTEDRLGKAIADLLENPLVTGAIGKAFDARDRAAEAQEIALGLLNLPTATDIERLTRRLRAVSQRLEGIEDGVQQINRALSERVVERRLEAVEAHLKGLSERLAGEEAPAKQPVAAGAAKRPAATRSAAKRTEAAAKRTQAAAKRSSRSPAPSRPRRPSPPPPA
jgi:hypothetical protein